MKLSKNPLFLVSYNFDYFSKQHIFSTLLLFHYPNLFSVNMGLEWLLRRQTKVLNTKRSYNDCYTRVITLGAIKEVKNA